MTKTIDLRARLASPGLYARLVWQEIFNWYRASGGNLDRMDNLLVDLGVIQQYATDRRDEQAPCAAEKDKPGKEREVKNAIRVVVEMHGGTIQGVYTDAEGVELDVVFTEARKYLGDSGEPEFEVGGEGPGAGDCVYTHHGSQQVPKEDLDPAFEAARNRIEALKDYLVKNAEAEAEPR